MIDKLLSDVIDHTLIWFLNNEDFNSLLCVLPSIEHRIKRYDDQWALELLNNQSVYNKTNLLNNTKDFVPGNFWDLVEEANGIISGSFVLNQIVKRSWKFNDIDIFFVDHDRMSLSHLVDLQNLLHHKLQRDFTSDNRSLHYQINQQYCSTTWTTIDFDPDIGRKFSEKDKFYLFPRIQSIDTYKSPHITIQLIIISRPLTCDPFYFKVKDQITSNSNFDVEWIKHFIKYRFDFSCVQNLIYKDHIWSLHPKDVLFNEFTIAVQNDTFAWEYLKLKNKAKLRYILNHRKKRFKKYINRSFRLKPKEYLFVHQNGKHS